ncbi:MAG: hypothetical protein V3575_06975 [Candidatus Absconditabacteria bacterium]
MFFVYVRMFTKLTLFFIGSLFIIFFIVFGFRYNNNVGFLQQNVYVEMTFWKEKSTISFGGNLYNSDDQILKLYNLHQGCYDIEYKSEKYNRCMKNDESYEDVFVEISGTSYIGYSLEEGCKNYSILPFEDYKVGGRVFSEQLKNSFYFRKIYFVQTSSSLYACNKNYSICKNLGIVDGEIMCGNKDGLIYYNSGYNLLKLQ